MSLVRLEQLFDVRGGVSQGDTTNGPFRTYTHKFRGWSNRINDDPTAILASGLCPEIGQRNRFVSDFVAYYIDVTAELEDKDSPGKLWTITTESSTQVQVEQNPLDEEAEFDWQSVRYIAEDCFDKDGKPVYNTAGDLLLFPFDASNWVVNVSRKLRSSPQFLFQYENAINQNSLFVDGVPVEKQKMRCEQLRIGRQQSVLFAGRTIRYRDVTFSLHHRAEGWKVQHPNVGFNELVKDYRRPIYDKEKRRRMLVDATTGLPRKEKKPTIVRIKLEDGSYPTEPQVLDKKGRYVKKPGINDVFNVEADKYEELDFNILVR